MQYYSLLFYMATTNLPGCLWNRILIFFSNNCFCVKKGFIL